MNDVNLKDIYSFYLEKFCNKNCILTTGYHKISPVQISFRKDQLPHLLGLHKIGYSGGMKTVTLIEQEKLTLMDIKNKQGYHEIKPRIFNFYQLEEMFYNEGIKTCILKKDNTNNTKMYRQLDIILINNSNNKSKVYVLGLKFNKKTSVYYPTTFFETKKSKYDSMRMTVVNKLTWI